MVSIKRQVRVAALQVLYEIDFAGHDAESVLARLSEEKALSGEATEFARRLVTGILSNEQEIDEAIERFAPAFPIGQVAVVDRNVLRLAIFEIFFDKSKTPVKAVVNEAVELAKAFGSAASPKFINGVLGSVIAEVAQ